jgi:hypothetical protein
MVDFTLPTSIQCISIDIDNLGWEDCFVEGQIQYSLIVSIKPMYLQYNPHGSAENWGEKFSKCLIGLRHKQWLYRNSDEHYVINNLTALQHGELAAKIGWLMRTNCIALLVRHQHYMKIDFAKLGRGPMIARQVWVTNMEMAIGIAKVAKGNFCTWESLRLLCTKIVLPVIQKCSPTPPANVSLTYNSSPFNHLSHLLTPISSY